MRMQTAPNALGPLRWACEVERRNSTAKIQRMVLSHQPTAFRKTQAGVTRAYPVTLAGGLATFVTLTGSTAAIQASDLWRPDGWNATPIMHGIRTALVVGASCAGVAEGGG